MRKKPKILQWALFLMLVFATAGCAVEEDYYQDNTTLENNAKVDFINFQKFKQHKKAVVEFDKIQQKNKNAKNILAKGTYLDDFGFSIDTDKILLIEEGDKKTFTFEIIRDSLETNDSKLENLVIVEKNDTFENYIVEYNLTSQEKELLAQDDVVELNQDPIVTNIANRATDPGEGYWDVVLHCIYRMDGSLYCYKTLEWFPSSGSGGGGGDTTGGDGSYEGCNCGDTGSTTTFQGYDTNGNPIFSTNPITGGSAAAAASNPCNKVKALKDKFPNIEQSLAALATTTNQSHENGFFIDNTATSSTTNPIQNVPPGTGGMIDINMSPPNPYVMFAHTHDAYGPTGEGTYSIFSWDDLAVINNLLQNGHIDNSNFVFYVFTADGTRYALTINNPSALSSFFYNPQGEIGTPVDVDRMLNLNNFYDNFYNPDNNPNAITENSSPQNDKLMFLKFIKEASLGITLLEIDANFNYKKLSLNSNGSVKETPCN